MLAHQTEIDRQNYQDEFLDQKIELQADCIKRLLFKDGVCDVGRGITDNYTLEAVIEDQQDEHFYKCLAALWMSKDSDLNKLQAVTKLIRYLDSMVDDASSFQAKHLLGVAQ